MDQLPPVISVIPVIIGMCLFKDSLHMILGDFQYIKWMPDEIFPLLERLAADAEKCQVWLAIDAQADADGKRIGV